MTTDGSSRVATALLAGALVAASCAPATKSRVQAGPSADAPPSELRVDVGFEPLLEATPSSAVRFRRRMWMTLVPQDFPAEQRVREASVDVTVPDGWAIAYWSDPRRGGAEQSTRPAPEILPVRFAHGIRVTVRAEETDDVAGTYSLDLVVELTDPPVQPVQRFEWTEGTAPPEVDVAEVHWVPCPHGVSAGVTYEYVVARRGADGAASRPLAVLRSLLSPGVGTRDSRAAVGACAPRAGSRVLIGPDEVGTEVVLARFRDDSGADTPVLIEGRSPRTMECLVFPDRGSAARFLAWLEGDRAARSEPPHGRWRLGRPVPDPRRPLPTAGSFDLQTIGMPGDELPEVCTGP